MITAVVIKDSISESGIRLTTLALTYPRFIHSELLTHRVFSRNSSSSRAIPTETLLAAIKNNPAMPIHWGLNQKGMQAYREVDDSLRNEAKTIWLDARDAALSAARKLQELRIHKQVTNRLLEPFSHIQTVVTSTEWDNFFKLRLHQDAQPEMQELAAVVKQSMDASNPTILKENEWHLPFIQGEDLCYPLKDCLAISAARCARVSYYLKDGSISNPAADIKLCHRLAGSDPKHLSPFEHVALCMNDTRFYANFRGWKQLRYFVELGHIQFMSDDVVESRR